MTRLVIVDDHKLVVDSLCRLLDAESDIDVVGKTGSGHEAVELCRDLKPDVVLLDYSLPDIDGLETTQQIAALGGDTRILILTMYANEEYATRLLKAGASTSANDRHKRVILCRHALRAHGVQGCKVVDVALLVQRLGNVRGRLGDCNPWLGGPPSTFGIAHQTNHLPV